MPVLDRSMIQVDFGGRRTVRLGVLFTNSAYILFRCLAPTRRSRPIAVTAATATVIATAACALLSSPARARGISHAATASMPSHTTGIKIPNRRSQC
jgi:hypothetical protein